MIQILKTWITIALTIGLAALLVIIVIGWQFISPATPAIDVTRVGDVGIMLVVEEAPTRIVAHPGEKVLIQDLHWTGATRIRTVGYPCDNRQFGTYTYEGTKLWFVAGDGTSTTNTCNAQQIDMWLYDENGLKTRFSITTNLLIRD